VRIGNVEAKRGTRAFGYLAVGGGRSRLAVDVPVHLVAGADAGPTLLVQGAVHGTEPTGTVGILQFLRDVDPARIRGTVIAVPALNRVGLERGERFNPIDGKDISRLFPGNPRGSLSDQLAHVYFHEVVVKADVMLDLHAAWKGHERYVVFTAERDSANPTALEAARRRLIAAFGTDAAYFPPDTFGTNRAEDAIADAGVVFLQPEMGGGAGWFAGGEAITRDIARGIRNVMRAMGMQGDAFEWDSRPCTIYNACVVFWKPPVDGLFIRRSGGGAAVPAGAVYGVIQNPYTGRVLAEVTNARDAVVLPSGQDWPTMGTTTVGILGVIDRVLERDPARVKVGF
jgi:predicted deacylase